MYVDATHKMKGAEWIRGWMNEPDKGQSEEGHASLGSTSTYLGQEEMENVIFILFSEAGGRMRGYRVGSCELDPFWMFSFPMKRRVGSQGRRGLSMWHLCHHGQISPFLYINGEMIKDTPPHHGCKAYLAKLRGESPVHRLSKVWCYYSSKEQT